MSVCPEKIIGQSNMYRHIKENHLDDKNCLKKETKSESDQNIVKRTTRSQTHSPRKKQSSKN